MKNKLFQGHSIIFTDGSKINHRVGCAFLMNKTKNYYRLADESSIFVAELKAIHLALLYINGRDINRNVVICTELFSCLKTLENIDSYNPILQQIHIYTKYYVKGG